MKTRKGRVETRIDINIFQDSRFEESDGSNKSGWILEVRGLDEEWRVIGVFGTKIEAERRAAKTPPSRWELAS